MRNLTKRVFSLVLALVLCFGIVAVGAEPVSAAEVPTIDIVPLVTNSADVQSFEVTVSAPATYSATYDGRTDVVSLETAGTHTISFNTRDDVRLTVEVPYDVDADGEPISKKARLTSINTYNTKVFCVDENGNTLKEDTIKLSKHNAPQVVYNAPAVIDGNEVEYHAANPSVVFKYGDGTKNINYTTVAKGAKTVTVNYVDTLDAVLYTETKVLNYGDTAVISAPATYEKDGSNYVLKNAASHDVTYENAQSVYTFEYVKQNPAAQTPYDITVKLVAENGTVLHTMKASVDVGGQATVTAPATYVVGMKLYALAEGQNATIVRDYASTDPKEYTVQYVLSGETAAEQVTINFVDQATGNVLDTLYATVEPDGAPFTYDISSKNYIVSAGTTYQVLAGQGNSKGKIVHAYGDATKVYTLYYAAKLAENPASYAVSMRYICVNDNVVLSTETQVVNANSSVTFEEAPATLTVAGKEYIRLNGQSGTTVHTYNDAQKNYEIYYRDASIKVENNDIIYIPGPGAEDDETSQPTKPEDNTGSEESTKPGDDENQQPESSESEKPESSETEKPVAPDTEPGTPDADTDTPEADTTVPGTQPTTPGAQTTAPVTQPTTPGAAEPEDDEEAAAPVADDNDEPSAPAQPETEEPEDDASVPSEETEIIEEDDVPLADKPVDAASEDTTSAMPFVFGGIGLIVIIILAVLFIIKKRRTA